MNKCLLKNCIPSSKNSIKRKVINKNSETISETYTKPGMIQKIMFKKSIKLK